MNTNYYDMSVDLLPEKDQLVESKKSVLMFGRIFVAVIIIFAVGAAVFSYKVVTTEQATEDSFIGRVSKLPVFSGLKYLTSASERGLRGQSEDRTNFLFLGIGGAGHDGPLLTDTVMLGSLRHSDGKVGVVSLPRDLSVDIPGYGWRKLNHANAYGEWEQEGYGPIIASQVVSNVTGQPIHYYVRVDFQGFVDFIDELGGIDVNVERSFTDYQYPAPYDKYQVVSFEAGPQHMDGETALVYVRSRHGTNGEASDFARSRRQQNVMVAVKEKILTPSFILNPKKIVKMYEMVKENVATNLTTAEMVELVKMSRKIDTDNISSEVLSTGPGSPLYATSINGAYMILPRGGTWDGVRAIAENILDEGEELAGAAADSTTDGEATIGSNAVARIEIQNGTNIPGLAYTASLVLKENEFSVVKIGNALYRDNVKTIIYDLTNGKKSEELNELRSLLGADISTTTSGWIFAPDLVPTIVTLTDETGKDTATVENIDFLVILGESSKNLVQ